MSVLDEKQDSGKVYLYANNFDKRICAIKQLLQMNYTQIGSCEQSNINFKVSLAITASFDNQDSYVYFSFIFQ